MSVWRSSLYGARYVGEGYRNSERTFRVEPDLMSLVLVIVMFVAVGDVGVV